MSARPRYKVGDTVRNLYYVPGLSLDRECGIPTDSAVKVVDVARQARGEMPRYKVEWNGGPGLWVYEDVLVRE